MSEQCRDIDLYHVSVATCRVHNVVKSVVATDVSHLKLEYTRPRSRDVNRL